MHNRAISDTSTSLSDRSTPYKFTGKEQDPETGLYYYGARYYDARLSRWASADPALIKYLPTGDDKKNKNLPAGGIYNTINLDLYHYAGNNPIKYLDPNGETSSFGIFGVGGFGFGGNVNIQIIYDEDYNIGLTFGGGAGPMAPELSVQVGVQDYSNKTIYDTAGYGASVSVGGGTVIGICGTVEYTNYLNGSKTINGDHAKRVSVGVGVGTPVSGGASGDKSVVWGVSLKTSKDNVKQLYNNVKNIVQDKMSIKDVFKNLKNPFGASDGKKNYGAAKK